MSEKNVLPPLTNEQLEAAKQELLVDFPRVIRGGWNNPDESKGYVIVSFLIFKNDETNEERSYVKLYAHSMNKQECLDRASKILKKENSKLPLIILPFGVWMRVCENPKEYSKENYKIIDEKLNLECENEEETKTLEKYKNIIEKSLREKEDESYSSMNERQESLTKYTADELHAYVLRLMMLHETRMQLKFLRKKETLLKEREACLVDLLSLDSEKYENTWEKTYEESLAATGQKSNAKKLDVNFVKQNLKETLREEIISKLNKCNNNYNNVKYETF